MAAVTQMASSSSSSASSSAISGSSSSGSISAVAQEILAQPIAASPAHELQIRMLRAGLEQLEERFFPLPKEISLENAIVTYLCFLFSQMHQTATANKTKILKEWQSLISEIKNGQWKNNDTDQKLIARVEQMRLYLGAKPLDTADIRLVAQLIASGQGLFSQNLEQLSVKKTALSSNELEKLTEQLIRIDKVCLLI